MGLACATTCHATPASLDASISPANHANCASPTIAAPSRSAYASSASRYAANSDATDWSPGGSSSQRAGAKKDASSAEPVEPPPRSPPPPPPANRRVAFANTPPPGCASVSVLAPTRVSRIATLATSPKCATRSYDLSSSSLNVSSVNPALLEAPSGPASSPTRVGSHSWYALSAFTFLSSQSPSFSGSPSWWSSAPPTHGSFAISWSSHIASSGAAALSFWRLGSDRCVAWRRR